MKQIYRKKQKKEEHDKNVMSLKSFIGRKHFALFQYELTFFTGACLVASQQYCLLYRLTVVLENRKIKEKSEKPKYIFLSFCVILFIACMVAGGAYIGLVEEKVSAMRRRRAENLICSAWK